MVKQDQEEKRQSIYAELLAYRMSLGIDEPRDDIDQSHEDRKNVDWETADHKQGIFFSEIADKAEGHAFQALHAGEKIICRDKERDLQKKRRRTAEGIDRGVVILAVEGLKDHEALVSGEGLLQMRDTGSHFLPRIPLRGLQLIRPLIEGQHEEIYRDTQHDDRQALVSDQTVGDREDRLEKELERSDKSGVEYRQKRHLTYTLLQNNQWDQNLP